MCSVRRHAVLAASQWPISRELSFGYVARCPNPLHPESFGLCGQYVPLLKSKGIVLHIEDVFDPDYGLQQACRLLVGLFS